MTNERLVRYCKENLDLKNVELGDEYYYSNLPLCIIDAVFSISIRYTATQNVVERFCKYFKIEKSRQDKNSYPPKETQLSINEFIDFYKQYDIDFFTKNIFDNRCRTSSRNGILKSEAVLEFAKVLQNFNVNYFQDINKSLLLNEDFEREIKKIKGQGSGISLAYFFMLAGSENLIKPDRMVKRFVEDATNETIPSNKLMQVFNDVFLILTKEFPHLTLRELDHEIWKYQRKNS